MRAPRGLALSVLAFAAALGVAARPARAVVVERVVAVVGDRPILKSELHARARPFLLQIAQRVPAGPQQTAAESTVFTELLQRMVDEELEIQAADKAKVTVTSDEIDSALHNVAAAQGITSAELMKGAVKSGLTEQEYREEMRRQILEFKMIQLRVKGRVRITEEDVKAMYERTLREERKRREYRPQWIVLRVPHASSREAMAERDALAADIVRRVRHGEDFSALAKRYSDDTATRDAGGDLGIKAPTGSPQATQGKRPTLAPDLEAAVMPLEPGQVTDPIHIADAIVILEVAERQPSRYTTYDAAKNEMVNRLQQEIMEKAKRKWLDELKAHTHLDIRL